MTRGLAEQALAGDRFQRRLKRGVGLQKSKRDERGVTSLTMARNTPWLGAYRQKGVASMTTNTAVKTSEFVERARALAPVVAQWRDAGEQARRLPRPLCEALRDAGIFSMAAPKAVGGAEAEEETILQA